MARKCTFSKWRILVFIAVAMVAIHYIRSRRTYFVKTSLHKSSRSQRNHEIGKVANSTTDQEKETIKRLILRRQHLLDVCKKRYPSDDEEDLNLTYVKSRFLKAALFFSDKHKVLFCQIPKCASRSQARFLAAMEGLVQPEEIYTLSEARATSLIARHLSPRRADSLDEVVKRIEEYTKVIIVREPISRLLSAFRNKLENSNRNGGYSTLARRLHTQYGNGTGEEVNGDPVIDLNDFLSYLIEERDSQNDQHWNFYHRLCSPCSIKYDYIITMDTIDEDIQYFKSRFGINVPFPPSYNSYTDKIKVKEYFAKANPRLVDKIFHLYEHDYDLFGFPPPPQF